MIINNLKLELSKDILKATISNGDKINLLSSLLCGDPLIRDNGFTIATQPRALELKKKVLEFTGDGQLKQS